MSITRSQNCLQTIALVTGSSILYRIRYLVIITYLKVVGEVIQSLLVKSNLAITMIIYVNYYGTHWFVEGKRYVIKWLFFTNYQVLDNKRLIVLIIDSNINFLFSKAIFTSEVTRLLYLEL